jgi:hypothetical protein
MSHWTITKDILLSHVQFDIHRKGNGARPGSDVYINGSRPEPAVYRNFAKAHTRQYFSLDNLVGGEPLIVEGKLSENKSTKFAESFTCYSAEGFLREVLTPKSYLYKNGHVYLFNGKPVGIIKSAGARNFIATRTVVKNSLPVCIFGGIYTLPIEQYDAIRQVSIIDNTWRFIDVDKLTLKPERPLIESLVHTWAHGNTLRELLREERKRIEEYLKV